MQYTNMQLHIEMIEKNKHKISNVLDYTDTSFQVTVKGYRACQKISHNASFLSFQAHLVNDNINISIPGKCGQKVHSGNVFNKPTDTVYWQICW